VKTILLGLVFLSPPFLKNFILRVFCGAKIGRGVYIGWFAGIAARQIELGDHCAIRALTLIRLAGDFQVGKHSEISSFNLIYGSSSLQVGDESYIGPQSLINVEEPVQIGRGSALGPGSKVFTHGSFLPFNEGYWARRAGVKLGDKVWCAAGVFLQPGVEIGDDTFVNSCAVVTQSIPPGSVVEGNPAQVVFPIARLKRKMTPARLDVAMAQVLRDFVEIGLRRELGVCDISEADGYARATIAGQVYEIALVRSTDATPRALTSARKIYMVNRADWSPPAHALILDWRTMCASNATDRIYTCLRVFMLRYYGMRFRETE